MPRKRKRKNTSSNARNRPNHFHDVDRSSHSLKKQKVKEPSNPASNQQTEIHSNSCNQSEKSVSSSDFSDKDTDKTLEVGSINNDHPNLVFRSKLTNSLRVKDLQDLILYVLADGIAPDWVAVKHAYNVQKVVFTIVPGLDESMLESLCNLISDQEKGICRSPDQMLLSEPQNSTFEERHDADSVHSVNENFKVEESSENLFRNKPDLHVVPIKAPGDYKTKVHPPSRVLLVIPAAGSRKKETSSLMAGKQSATASINVIELIHPADVLLESGYPVHSYGFGGDKSSMRGGLDKNKPAQDEAASWVSSNISSSVPAILLQSDKSLNPLTRGMTVYSIDCEMVVTTDDCFALARVSVVDWEGAVVLDKFVKPSLPVKHYHTQYSGITPQTLENITDDLSDIQRELLILLTTSTVLLGHSLENDLRALKLTHPFLIDTSIIYPHPSGLPFRSSLKFLAKKYLNREIQKSTSHGHDSVEDSRAVLDLVKLKCEKGLTWGLFDSDRETIFQKIMRQSRADGTQRQTAMVGYGSEERTFAKEVNYSIKCQRDKEVIQGIARALKGNIDGSEGGPQGVDFIWSRLGELERARGLARQKPEGLTIDSDLNENENKDQKRAPLPNPASGSISQADLHKEKDGSSENGSTTDKLPVLDLPDPLTRQQQIEDKVDRDQQNLKSSAYTDLQSQITETVGYLLDIYKTLPPASLLIIYSGPGDMSRVRRLQKMHQQYRSEFNTKKWDELAVKWTDKEQENLRMAVEEARKGTGLLCIK